MWGSPSDVGLLDWTWVADQLTATGTYWVVPQSSGRPHPRPVWGIWDDGVLCLSIGSPMVARDLAATQDVTVHLGSDLDVVVVEGIVSGTTGDLARVSSYNTKYDWNYAVDEYGEFTIVTPNRILAWRTEGWAGRDGIKQAGRWQFETT
jgi:hypothetical protein